LAPREEEEEKKKNNNVGYFSLAILPPLDWSADFNVAVFFSSAVEMHGWTIGYF
jgi:hypothetical protein